MMAKPKPGGRRPRKRERKNVTYGVAHIKSSFNNTIVSITDQEGNVLAWASAGNVGSRAPASRTPFAAQMAAEQCARRAMEHGVRKVDVLVKGPGSGRETAIRSIQNTGIEVTGIKDVTPVPHNGCRPPKRREAESDDGSLHRPGLRVSAGASDEALSRAPRATDEVPDRAAPLPAGRARPHPPPRARLRVPGPAAGEAEGPPHLRPHREAVPQPLRGGQPPEGRHRREPAPLLELRLDNVVYRAGWAATRTQARQFVRHGHVNVNGRRVDHPELPRPQGRRRRASRDKASDDDRRPSQPRHARPPSPPWLEAATRAAQVTVRDLPLREHIDVPVREQLIVELYSK